MEFEGRSSEIHDQKAKYIVSAVNGKPKNILAVSSFKENDSIKYPSLTVLLIA